MQTSKIDFADGIRREGPVELNCHNWLFRGRRLWRNSENPIVTTQHKWGGLL